VTVSTVAHRSAGFCLLPSAASLRWESASVGDALPCPEVYCAGEYGTFVDYVVRHFMTPSGQFRDSRAECCVRSIENEGLKAAYAATCEPRPTHSVIAELFTVSKAHTHFFVSQGPECELSATAYDGNATGPAWLERLESIVSVALSGISGSVIPNPAMKYSNAGCFVLGDADLLIDGTLVELKTSKSRCIPAAWKCQVLLYAAILRTCGHRVSSVVFLNAATGVAVRADLSAWQEGETLVWLEGWYCRNMRPSFRPLRTCDKAANAEWYGRLAGQGNPEAQYCLGEALFYGEGVLIDKPEAVAWYRKSAERGHMHAEYNLGYAYYNGDGVQADKAVAMEWYRKAAERGHADAQYHLGFAYFTGDGAAADKPAAVAWYRRAAKEGHVDAQYKMGLVSFTGEGVPPNTAAAVGWLRKASKQGHASAQRAHDLVWPFFAASTKGALSALFRRDALIL
jgi:hypothetical protein